MARRRVVILSAHSLFAEGITSRLREHRQLVDLRVVEPDSRDALAQVAALQPDIVIIDAGETAAARSCPLETLLAELPRVKIIRLDPRHSQIQVVTSEQRPAQQAMDLLEMIEHAA